MDYIQRFKLDCRDYRHPAEMYPDAAEKDIVTAVYRNVCGITNPDICALPPRLSAKDLISENSCHYINNQATSKSERLSDLMRLKDSIRFYLPYHADLERKFQDCLESAYSRRRYGYLPGVDAPPLLSVAQQIDTSVQDMSLIGTAGSGKSSAVAMMLSRYPTAIRHDINGYKYIQIPCLATTAYKSKDIKSVYLLLSKRIDDIVGISYYEGEMIRKNSVPKMEAYMIKLIQIFHIGAICIDEIQLALDKKSMFQHLLSLTASAGVSLMLIGTEAAINELNSNLWFSRRFSQLGCVRSDLPLSDKDTMRPIVRQLWPFQLVHKKASLTKKIENALIAESGNNIDFLITIFVTAQFLVIESEGSDNEIILDYSTIKKAAARYPMAQKQLLKGVEKMDAERQKEKELSFSAAVQLITDAKKEEQDAIMSTAPAIYKKQQDDLKVIVERLSGVGYTDQKAINKLYKKMSTDKGFSELEISQKIKRILVKMMEDDDNTDAPKPRTSKPIQIMKSREAYEHQDNEEIPHGSDILSEITG